MCRTPFIFLALITTLFIGGVSSRAEEQKRPKIIDWNSEVESALKEMGFEPKNLSVPTPVFSIFQSWGWSTRDSQTAMIRFEIHYNGSAKKSFSNVRCELEIFGKEDGKVFSPEKFEISHCELSVPNDSYSNYSLGYEPDGAENLSVIYAQARSRAVLNTQKTADSDKTSEENADSNKEVHEQVQQQFLEHFFALPFPDPEKNTASYVSEFLAAYRVGNSSEKPVECVKADSDPHYIPGDLSTINYSYFSEAKQPHYFKKYSLAPALQWFLMQLPHESKGERIIAVEIYSDSECKNQVDSAFTNTFSGSVHFSFEGYTIPDDQSISLRESLIAMLQLLSIPHSAETLSYDEDSEELYFTILDPALKKEVIRFSARVHVTGDSPWEHLEIFYLRGKVVQARYEKILKMEEPPKENEKPVEKTPALEKAPVLNTDPAVFNKQYFAGVRNLPGASRAFKLDEEGFYAFALNQMGFAIDEARIVGGQVCQKAVTEQFSTIRLPQESHGFPGNETTFYQTRYFLVPQFQTYMNQVEGKGYLYFVAIIYEDENCNRPQFYTLSRIAPDALEEPQKSKILEYFKEWIEKESNK